jgi:hypothetical protein
MSIKLRQYSVGETLLIGTMLWRVTEVDGPYYCLTNGHSLQWVTRANLAEIYGVEA